MDGTLTPPGLIDFNLLRTSIRSIASSDPANANGKLNLDEDALVLARQLSGEGRARCSEVLKEVEEKCLVDLRLVDGVKEVMEHCAENHVRAAVVTRNVERTMFRLKALIGDRKREDGTFVLDPMIARDTVKNDGSGERVKSKPHPEALSYICSCWGLDARSVCMVGDSLEDDVQAAARAGCRSLLINTGFDNSTGSRRSDVGDGELAEPDWVVGGFSEVLGVLRREGVAQ